MLKTATTLPEPHSPSSWPWVELGSLKRLNNQRYSLDFEQLHPRLSGLRILHLSDLHIDRQWMPAWDQLIARVQNNPPDLICLTGDLVDNKFDHRPALPLLDRLLKGLKARLGIFAILGNHDTELLPLRAGSAPIHLLCNEKLVLKDGDASIEIIGLHGVHPLDVSESILDKLFGDADDRAVRVLLSHYPMHAIPIAERKSCLILSGHTHGGQVCLPGGIPLITHDHLPRRFARGAHRIGSSWLVTSRGCGFSKHNIRLFCPAETIEITLASRPAQQK